MLVGAGCYAPSFQDCELVCAGAGPSACPDGLTCAAGVCRLPGMTAACTPTIDAPGTCWPYTASTIDPCAADFPPSVGPLSVPAMRTIDTTSLGQNDGVPYLGGRYTVLHVDSVSIAPGAVLTVTGARPLIIVSEGNVDIAGIITVQPTPSVPMDCAVGSAAAAGPSGAGGAGGGYGTPGGNGGAAVSSSSTSGGGITGDAMLDPLRPGCPGGRGGIGTPGPTGAAGRGGGALQITSRTQILLTAGGTVAAGGGGGGGGFNGTTCVGTACTSGGGGGGTGGSILLEANRVEVRANGKVCAVGGGGGNGPQTIAPIASGGAGADGNLCSGGMPGAVGNRGGRGADVAAAPGASGSSGSGNLESGAGGGGGLGRTRIRGIAVREVVGTTIPVAQP